MKQPHSRSDAEPGIDPFQEGCYRRLKPPVRPLTKIISPATPNQSNGAGATPNLLL